LMGLFYVKAAFGMAIDVCRSQVAGSKSSGKGD
jgi:hypothetical protein